MNAQFHHLGRLSAPAIESGEHSNSDFVSRPPQKTHPPSLSDQRLFLKKAKEACEGLFQIEAHRYWRDFLLSVTFAYLASSVFLALPLSSPIAWLAFVVGGVLIYRASMFVHELVHLPQHKLPIFRRVWNLVAGVPMMVPTFSYQSHTHHHNARHYGTARDGEYLPLGLGSIGSVLVFLSQIVFQPLLVFFRYLILTPLSFVHPRLRTWTLIHASSLVINFQYADPNKVETHSAEDTWWEVLTSLRAMVMVGLVAGGVMPWERLPKILLISMFVLSINHVRTLVAHRYRSQGQTLSHLEQFQDSTNIVGAWWTELWCPLGLRYHALHHLFPGIPYYNLGKAHLRLMNAFEAGSIYHQSVYPNFQSAFGEWWSTLGRKETQPDTCPAGTAVHPFKPHPVKAR